MSALRLASVCRAVLRPALSGAPVQRGIAPAQRGIATSSVCMAKDIKTPDSLQASVGIERYEKLCHLAVSSWGIAGISRVALAASYLIKAFSTLLAIF